MDARETGRHFLSLIIDGRSHEAGLEKRPGGLHGRPGRRHGGGGPRGSRPRRRRPGDEGGAGPPASSPPCPGKLVRVLVSAGQAVEAGQGLVVIEAMKMENELKAPRAGRVKHVPVREGQPVEAGALLVVLE